MQVTLDRSGGGHIRYNYGEFAEVRYPSFRHIKDLACGVAGTWPDKPEVRNN